MLSSQPSGQSWIPSQVRVFSTQMDELLAHAMLSMGQSACGGGEIIIRVYSMS